MQTTALKTRHHGEGCNGALIVSIRRRDIFLGQPNQNNNRHRECRPSAFEAGLNSHLSFGRIIISYVWRTKYSKLHAMDIGSEINRRGLSKTGRLDQQARRLETSSTILQQERIRIQETSRRLKRKVSSLCTFSGGDVY